MKASGAIAVEFYGMQFYNQLLVLIQLLWVYLYLKYEKLFRTFWFLKIKYGALYKVPHVLKIKI